MSCFAFRGPVAGIWLALSVAIAPVPAAEPGPVVVELFTSQGCNSCPPADALLGELARRDDVIALSLHVDYWDYIGWTDPFASADMTARQRGYARRRGSRTVYTPQMVIDGRFEIVGSRRETVNRTIEQARAKGMPVALRLEESGVTVPAGHAPDTGADLWLVAYDDLQATDVARGENAGRQIENHHVVRVWRRLADWTGQELEVPLDLETLRSAGREGVVVLLQAADHGPILGAAELALSAKAGSTAAAR